MKICICDDEKDFIHNFQLLLKQYSKKHKNINQFNSFENEYIETYNRNILFHLTSGSEITGHESLKAYEDKLDERFYRCHTGYIVNMAYVTSIQKDCAILNSNVTVPVSRYKKKKFQMLFTDFLCNSIF